MADSFQQLFSLDLPYTRILYNPHKEDGIGLLTWIELWEKRRDVRWECYEARKTSLYLGRLWVIVLLKSKKQIYFAAPSFEDAVRLIMETFR